MTLVQILWANHITLRASNQEASSAEVGALTQVFEKPAAELKPEPKLLLTCKNIVHMATFNVWTLNTVN